MASLLSAVVDFFFFFFNDTATTEIYTLSLHDALPISLRKRGHEIGIEDGADIGDASLAEGMSDDAGLAVEPPVDRKSTRLNSSHGYISYAVFCLKKKRRRSRVGDDVAHNSCCVLHFSC